MCLQFCKLTTVFILLKDIEIGNICQAQPVISRDGMPRNFYCAIAKARFLSVRPITLVLLQLRRQLTADNINR